MLGHGYISANCSLDDADSSQLQFVSDVNKDLGPKDTGHKAKAKALGYQGQGQGLGSQGQGQGLEMSTPITKTEGHVRT